MKKVIMIIFVMMSLCIITSCAPKNISGYDYSQWIEEHKHDENSLYLLIDSDRDGGIDIAGWYGHIVDRKLMVTVGKSNGVESEKWLIVKHALNMEQFENLSEKEEKLFSMLKISLDEIGEIEGEVL